MANYKKLGTGIVISESDYNRLPYSERMKYTRNSFSRVTHSTNANSNSDSSDDLLIGLAVTAMISSFDSSPSYDSSSSCDSGSSSSFDSFGGGDFGGGGGGSDW